MSGATGRATVGGLDEAEAGCIYDFDEGRDVVLVGFGGLIKEELVGFGEPASPTPLAAPFEFLGTASDLPVGKVFVRDLDQIFYQRGVRGLGRDVAEVASGLGSLLSGSGRVVFVGQSAGGYAALLFGTMLGVDHVLAFSPVTFLTPLLRRVHRDDRWPEEMAEIRRLSRFRRHLDLRRAIRARGQRSELHVYFGAKNLLDRTHAGRLEGLPGVTLHPWATASHAVARRMREEGELKPVLLRALGHLSTS